MLTFSVNKACTKAVQADVDLSTDLTRRWAGQFYIDCLVEQGNSGRYRNYNSLYGYASACERQEAQRHRKKDVSIQEDECGDEETRANTYNTMSIDLASTRAIEKIEKDDYELVESKMDSDIGFKVLCELSEKIAKLDNINLFACISSALKSNVEAVDKLKSLLVKYDFCDLFKAIVESNRLSRFLASKGY